MTNRELLQKAMPLISLSRTEWKLLNSHIENIQDTELLKVLQTLQVNQSRIEIKAYYNEYYNDILDEEILDKSFPIEM